MTERWREVVRVKQVGLDAFTQDELEAVTLDPGFLPALALGPALPAAAPLLAALAAQQEGPGERPVPASFPPSPATGPDAVAAAARLEQRGYLRPGVAAPASGPVPDELAGWSADPAGLAAARPVAITGDLGIVMRMRALPYWVAEVSAAPGPARPDPAAGGWPRTARLYAAYRPQAALLESLDGPPSFTLLWQEFAVATVMDWLGVGPAELMAAGQGRSVAQRHADAARTRPAVATAEVAGRFARVAQVRVAHPPLQEAGPIMLRRLIVATGTSPERWVLEGEHAEQAVSVTVDQVGERVEALLEPSGKAADQPG
jgi:hypothetical protein